MRIAITDTNQGKFTRDMMRHWQSQGHHVKLFGTCRRPHMEWADVLWFDCVDGNLVAATKKAPELTEGKFVIARAIDIDVWACHFNAVNWSRVNHIIFIAKHIKDYMLEEKNMRHKVHCPVHLIPCGVDTNRFTMRRNPVRNNNVAVVMRLWHGKGIALLLQLIADMPDYHFHICGKWGMSGIEKGWFKHYIDDYLSRHDNWTHVAQVDDMNEWLEDKAYALIPSMKEAFSYAAAEAMAKGIKPAIHNFYGASTLWPEEYRWSTIGQVREIFSEEYKPERYRGYIEGAYPLSKMMNAFDKILEEAS